jgi:hypothetical protein
VGRVDGVRWSKLERVTTTTIKSRYWAGLYKFVDFAIAESITAARVRNSYA